MNTFFLYLLLALPSGDSIHGRPYELKDRYNDSLLIYNIYRSQIEDLMGLKPTDLTRWNERTIHDDTITACAKVRLRLWNKTSYLPTDEANREGYGTAYVYPTPSEESYVGVFIESSKKYYYVVYDHQTHFITESLGKTKIPYITKTVFNKGRVVSIEKLNPVTLEKLP